MNNFDIITGMAKKNNGLVTRKEAAAQGVQSWYFSQLLKENKLIRLERGIYTQPDNFQYDEDYFFQVRNAKGIFSYQSALYYNGLSERIPFQKEITVPRGYNTKRISGQALVHSIARELYPIGITKTKTPMGNEISVYNIERTICDMVKSREKQDTEIFSKAVNLYIKRPDRDIKLLREYAAIFHIEKKVEDILDIILK